MDRPTSNKPISLLAIHVLSVKQNMLLMSRKSLTIAKPSLTVNN